MKKALTLLTIGLTTLFVHSQNTMNAIKTSKRAGILSTLINPAELASMPQKFDLNLIGFDMQVANNVVNLTSSEAGKTDNFTDRFFNSVGADGLDVKVNIDIIGPALAFAYNKKTSFGLMTRGRFNVAMNHIDIVTGKALVDGKTNSSTPLPYTTPDINNMSATVVGWGEIGASVASEVYQSGEHAIKIGGTIKGLFSGAYANTYLTNFKMTIDTLAGGNVQMSNGSGRIGVEYSGSSDPTQGALDNLLGSPKGVGLDVGVSYEYRDLKTKAYILRLGASILDMGSLKYTLQQKNSRQFLINPSATINPNQIQGEDLDAIITNIKNTGAVTEVEADTTISIALPMAFNLQADWNVYKPLYITVNFQRAMTDNSNPRNMRAANYITIIPRIAFKKIIEFYLPYTYADLSGSSLGAGLKLGPLYIGSSSFVSALVSENNKAIDFHVGFKASFGKSMH